MALRELCHFTLYLNDENIKFYFEKTHNWMMGKFLTNLKGAFESEELFLLNYRKNTNFE